MIEQKGFVYHLYSAVKSFPRLGEVCISGTSAPVERAFCAAGLTVQKADGTVCFFFPYKRLEELVC